MANTMIINEDMFVLDGINYERDDWSGRYYRLEESISLRREMDGALVRRRISKKVYLKNLEECKIQIAEQEALRCYVRGEIDYDQYQFLVGNTRSGYEAQAV
jgi:hypothetical protein